MYPPGASTPAANWRRGLSLAAIAAGVLFFPDAASGAAYVPFALLLIVAGIPHGAADHLLFRRARDSGVSWRQVLPRFLGFYGLLVVTYGLLWWAWPTAALGLFLLASAYHFGQTHYHAADLSAPCRTIVFVLAGAFFIGFPVLLHPADALPILEQMLGRTLRPAAWWTGVVPWVLLAVNLLVAAVLPTKRPSVRGGRTLDILLLATLFYGLPLLVGFAVFFLLWHSWPAAVDQYRLLKRAQPELSVGRYALALLPLSLGALLSLVALLSFTGDWLDGAAAAGWLFVFVAVITLPHAVLVDGLYRGRRIRGKL